MQAGAYYYCCSGGVGANLDVKEVRRKRTTRIILQKGVATHRDTIKANYSITSRPALSTQEESLQLFMLSLSRAGQHELSG